MAPCKSASVRTPPVVVDVLAEGVVEGAEVVEALAAGGWVLEVVVVVLRCGIPKFSKILDKASTCCCSVEDDAGAVVVVVVLVVGVPVAVGVSEETSGAPSFVEVFSSGTGGSPPAATMQAFTSEIYLFISIQC